MPRVKGHPPRTTAAGLVHLHALVGPAVYAALKLSAERNGLTISAVVHVLLADAVGCDELPIISVGKKFQADR